MRRLAWFVALGAVGCMPALQDIPVTRADMSRVAADRQACTWEAQVEARCSTFCQHDPRPTYKLCMLKLGYTVEGVKP